MRNYRNDHELCLTSRRNLILDAAHYSFRNKGLYRTSISDIGQLTNLGTGQIYRCFSNKEEIIEEIVQRVVTCRNQELEKIASALVNNEDISITQNADDALLLEIYVEARHNKNITDILLKTEGDFLGYFKRMMKTRYPWLSDVQILVYAESMVVLTEGTLVRNLRWSFSSGAAGKNSKKSFQRIAFE